MSRAQAAALRQPAEEERVAAPVTRRGSLFWKVWLPIPIFFVLLDCTFNLFFWHIPKVTGAYADYGYQFLIGVHRLYEPKPQGEVRVLAFGSSVSKKSR